MLSWTANASPASGPDRLADGAPPAAAANLRGVAGRRGRATAGARAGWQSWGFHLGYKNGRKIPCQGRAREPVDRRGPACTATRQSGTRCGLLPRRRRRPRTIRVTWSDDPLRRARCWSSWLHWPPAGRAGGTRPSAAKAPIIRNAALARDNGPVRPAFIDRLTGDLWPSAGLPLKLRWFARDRADELLLIRHAERVFDQPGGGRRARPRLPAGMQPPTWRRHRDRPGHHLSGGLLLPRPSHPRDAPTMATDSIQDLAPHPARVPHAGGGGPVGRMAPAELLRRQSTCSTTATAWCRSTALRRARPEHPGRALLRQRHRDPVPRSTSSTCSAAPRTCCPSPARPCRWARAPAGGRSAWSTPRPTLARSAGLDAVMDRCVKIEHARLLAACTGPASKRA